MFFIHPMWADEVQRIGKQKCTPIGYAVHVFADLLGFIGLLILLGTLAYLAYRGIAGNFTGSLFWLLAAPFGLGVVSEVLFRFSWWLAEKKGFRYDYSAREATWIEAGERRSYKWSL